MVRLAMVSNRLVSLIPDPLSDDRQYARFYHLDIEEIGDTELIDELYALRPLLWGLDSDHWFRERVKMLEHELAKRRGDTTYKASRQPKPKQAEGVTL